MKGKSIIKVVDPQGLLLNDNDVGVDHLDQSAYAEAIADSIHQVETPITIGLFARWGTGKSFLVKHILSSLKKLQKQSELDDAEAEEVNKIPKSFCSAPHCSKRWCIGLTAMILLMCASIFAMIITIHPGLLQPDYINSEAVTRPSNVTTIATTIDPVVEHGHFNTIIRYVGVGVMIFIIMMVLFVTCCSQLVSKSYYGQVRLLAYALFTKIPITKEANEYVIGDPGETDSNLLRRADPNEVIAAAAVSSSVFPRKYIFVNFRAWEFAGSDRIWAGIVTNLASAIEAEFGIVTSRLFRTTNFEQLHPTLMIKGYEQSKIIYVDLTRKLEEDKDGILHESDVKDAMKQYGVVRSCKKTEDRSCKKTEKRSWWMVEFEQPAEARNASDCLGVEGVCVKHEMAPAIESSRPDRYDRTRESRRPLVDDHNHNGDEVIECVEMEPLNATPLSPPPEPEEINFERHDGRCGRFCSHWSRHPTIICCCPYLLWVILLLVCLVILPLAIFMFAEIFELETARTFWGVSRQSQFLLWLPGGLSVVAFGLKFGWAMCNSQRSRVSRALNGTSSSMSTELGFMRKVKNEIAIMTQLIHCARFVFKRDYKIVISVDDVDRVALNKVKSVLEAVSILLSDRSSPFICLIAVDSRIAVKCIEESLGEELVKANVSGHEYLKKIINLPVCLPEIENICKRRFIAGLIDQADHTTCTRNTDRVEVLKEHKRGKKKRPLKSESGDTFDGEASSENTEDEEEGDILPSIDGKAFLFACREFIYNNHRLHGFLNGSPRNIKRIFNIISLTGSIIRQQLAQSKRQKLVRSTNADHNCKHLLSSAYGDIKCDQQLVEDIVHWIVLTDQWPYRTSYILQVIEDADQRVVAHKMDEYIDDRTSLFEVYQSKVLCELHLSQHSLLSLDNDADLLLNFLISIKNSGLTKGRTKQLAAWTINLDRSIRQTIALQREIVVINNAKIQKICPELLTDLN